MEKNIFTHLWTPKSVFFFIVLFYLFAAFVQFSFTQTNEIDGMYFGLPIMQTGDEPHYYATLYSLVNDHDFYMTNNYNNALLENGGDLGTKQLPLFDRHTRLYDSAEKTVTDIPFIDETHLDLSKIPQGDSVIKEIPGHPLGLPFFAFLFLWPLKNTAFLEHAALFLTLFFSVLALYFFYKTLLYYHMDEKKALLYTFILACATQYWHYSKTFWAEPYLASFVILSWYLLLVKKTWWSSLLAGTLLGFGFLMKYPFVLIIFSFFLWLFFACWQKENRKNAMKNFFLLCIPLLTSLLVVFYLNSFLTGTIFGFNQADAVHFVLPFGAIIRWLFDPTFGLFLFSPVLILGIVGTFSLWKERRYEMLTFSVGFLLYFLFWTSYIVSQYGGGGYSARYLLPILPFLVILLSFSGFETSNRKTLKSLFYMLLVVSFLINTLAAFAYPAFSGYSFVVSLEKIFSFIKDFF